MNAAYHREGECVSKYTYVTTYRSTCRWLRSQNLAEDCHSRLSEVRREHEQACFAGWQERKIVVLLQKQRARPVGSSEKRRPRYQEVDQENAKATD